jgi:hypothetical protein
MNENQRTTVQESSGLSRRDFIAKTMLVGGGLAVNSLACATSQNWSNSQATSNNQGNKSESTLGERRKLGTLEVSALGLGCMNMVWAYGPPVDKEPCDLGNPGCVRSRSDVLRYSRDLWTIHRRRVRWRSARSRSRPRCHRNEVRLRHRPQHTPDQWLKQSPRPSCNEYRDRR